MTRAGTIVVVEDDPNIADLVDLYLRQAGFRVLQSTDGQSGFDAVSTHDPDLVILDVGLPGQMDGLELCRRLRAERRVPIIMLTARDGEIDRVLGLELGADDYVTKPFSPRELVARVKAVLRRFNGNGEPDPGAPATYELGNIKIDTGRREVTHDGRIVTFAAREFDLLAHFAANPGLVLTRRQLLDGVWGEDWIGDERTVDVHVRQLRKKLAPDLPLDTVWGVGYRMG